jgi:hypothetical protein
MRVVLRTVRRASRERGTPARSRSRARVEQRPIRACLGGGVGHDARPDKAHPGRRDDVRSVPIYLMTGVYDFACTPEMTEEAGKKIKGSETIIMEESRSLSPR